MSNAPMTYVPQVSAPNTVAQKPANNFFGGIGDTLSRGLNSFIQLQILKSFQDFNDDEFGYTYDPYNGLQIGNVKTAGSVGPRSLWRATDMFWIAGAGALVLAIFVLKK